MALVEEGVLLVVVRLQTPIEVDDKRQEAALHECGRMQWWTMRQFDDDGFHHYQFQAHVGI